MTCPACDAVYMGYAGATPHTPNSLVTLPAMTQAVPRTWRAWNIALAALLACALTGSGILEMIWATARPAPVPVVAPVNVFHALFDPTPVRVTLTIGWHKTHLTYPRWRVTSDAALWNSMRFEDWDRVPDDVRDEGLSALFDRYGGLVDARERWASMRAEDWDHIPHPVRAMAFVGMIEHWMTFYRVNERWNTAVTGGRDLVPIAKAIAMSESWFEHRGVHVNRDGSADLGIGGTSEFARRVIRLWHERGDADFSFTDLQYFNPWHATRALVFWFDEMLLEAQGDVDVAVRAYNVGLPAARQGGGQEYLDGVLARERRYFSGGAHDSTWSIISRFRRAQRAGRG